MPQTNFLTIRDRLRIAASVMQAGFASLTIDMPGSGENPMLYGDPAAERPYFKWMDYLLQGSELDGGRVGVWGGSFGAYWAARLAFVATERIKGAVPWRQHSLRLPEGMVSTCVHNRWRGLSFRRRVREVGRQEVERDCHVDLANAEAFPRRNTLGICRRFGDELIEPAASPCN